jgi:hypothetical protein
MLGHPLQDVSQAERKPDRHRSVDPAELVERGVDAEATDHSAGMRVPHPRNPVLDWCVSNAVVTMDAAGGRKLDKSKATGRIDGLQAAAMAIGLAARTPAKKPSVYQSRGVFTVDAA